MPDEGENNDAEGLEPADAWGLEPYEHLALVPLYEQALDANPDDIEALYYLGNAYTRLGRIRDGLRIDERLVHILPDDPTVRYNLACSYSLAGRIADSLDALQKAVDLGYADGEFMKSDGDLAAVREDSRFRDILSQLGA